MVSGLGAGRGTWGAWAHGAVAAACAFLAPAGLDGQTETEAAAASEPGAATSRPLRVLDVPYLPQSEALCGGAAAAMVMRYWGGDASPEAFADLVRPDEGGIRPGELAAEVRRLGWTVERVAGRPEAVRAHVAQGRPVVLLLRVGPGRFHYVTVVATPEGEWLVHDPALAPYRRLSREELLERWEPSSRWGAVIVPGDGDGDAPAAGRSDTVPGTDRNDGKEGRSDAGRRRAPGAAGPDVYGAGCEGRVSAGVRAARSDRTARADSLLRGAVRRCPDSGAARRELAGLRFLQGRWRASATLAEEALAVAPGDDHAVRTLAAARYMAGDEDGALEAWNRLGEPRLTGLRVYGLRRTRYRPLRRQVGLPAGGALSPGDLRSARRRVAAVPALASSRVGFRAPSDGRTELEVALVERPLLPPFPAGVAGLAVRSAVDRELRLSVASPTGGGELWTASWSWWEQRPHVRVELAAPAAFGRPGVWSVEGSWRRAAFRVGPTGSVSPAEDPAREERRRAALSLARWVDGSLRLEAAASLEDWSRLGRRAGLDVEARVRDGAGRVAVRASAGGAVGPGADYWRAGLETGARWQGPEPFRLRTRAGLEAVGKGAPRMLWPGAGAGYVRRPLLRAHPLVRDGVVVGPAFGRVLAHGGVEPEAVLPSPLPVSLRAAAFVDVARAWRGGTADGRVLVDVGAGLRLGLPGTGGRLRVDGALSLVDGSEALSVGWEAPWPGW